MSKFVLAIEASAVFSLNAPTLEVLVDGVVVSSALVTSQTGSGYDLLSFTLDFTGSFPTSLSFRFNDGFGEPGRSVTLENVRIGGQAVDTTYLSMLVLNQNDSSNVTIAPIDHFFGRDEPLDSDLGTVTINGTGAADDLRGASANDVIDGGSGNDRIFGGSGNDAVIGGVGNDFIFGGAGNDLLTGGANDDIALGGLGDDLIFGNDGNDTLVGDGGNDVINGGLGNDALVGDAGADVLYGGDGDDALIGDAGDDWIFGDAGNDIIDGGDGNDTIYGGTGVDYIAGKAGNDTIYAEDGDDDIDGGDGNDTIDGGLGSDRISGGLGDDVISGGDNIDYLVGDDGNDTLNGDAAGDALAGGSGADTLNGGDGNDALYGHSLSLLDISQIVHDNVGVSYSLATHSFYMLVNTPLTYVAAKAAAEATMLNGVAGNLVTISSASENSYVQTLLGGSDIWLGASDETIEGTWRWQSSTGDGVQFSNGGVAVNGMYTNWLAGQPDGAAVENFAIMNVAGDWSDITAGSTHNYIIEWDGYLFDDDNAVDTLNGGAGNDLLYGYGGDDILNGEADNDILYGGAGNDVLSGGAGNDTIFGESGNDVIEGGDNDDVLDGGTGTDTLTYASAAAGVTANLATLTAQNTIGAGIDTIAGFENLTGSSLNDTLTGDAGSNEITGGVGADILDGGAGNDTFFLANGDFASGESITDSGGTDNITLSNATTVDFTTGTLSGVEALNGSSSNDTVTLAAATLTGVFTNIDLAVGADILNTVGNSNISAGTLATISGVETGNITGTGGNDTFTATGAQIDALIIGSGIINMGAGAADTINITSTSADLNTLGATDASIQGLEIISASTAAAGVTINMSGQSEAMTITGSNSGDTITGGAGNDILNGRTGNDTLNGGTGTDTVTYANAASAVTVSLTANTASGGDGNDTLSGIENITGSDFNDTLTGDAGSNVLDGGNGNDTLNGRAGNDTLIGGAGTDTATYANAASAVTVSLTTNTASGGDGNDTLSGIENLIGSAFNDTLTGGTGTNIIQGGAGNDSITSGTADTLATQISTILAANPGVIYDSTTGNFYQYVNTNATWVGANTAATGSTINGVAGHLVQITSSYENSMIDALLGADETWLGGSDSSTEGAWLFTGGLLDGIQFWSGTSTGSAQNGFYTNWAAGQPNASNPNIDYQFQNNGGTWDDLASTGKVKNSYVIEWEGVQLLTPTASNTLSGGTGTDTLYGGAGQDIFWFEAGTSATSDTINNYDRTDLDKLDISDLLSGYVAGTSDDDDFARFTVSGADLLLQVDANGASGGASFTTIATLSGHGASEFNVEEFVAQGLLIMV